ncbi:hypothetical protein [Curtobacterium sp. MCPF17_031]|uniref:hypothetical protein n=1 Tax=Curtobacterium sp. MCPF17_031 TaxID=2175653 RepID=UPI000DAA5451|nr:hypothetical protein [Curtobacterium sp. MCPF17_031]PZE33340.1 hypothetical protein DEJ31_16480 [Curtobacterium sp. MCPF17_031]
MTDHRFAERARSVAAADIRERFEAVGSAQVYLSDLVLPVSEWRRVARHVAHGLGRPVETLAVADFVVARLRDWPRDDAEQRITEARMRAAVDAVSSRSISLHASEVDGSV